MTAFEWLEPWYAVDDETVAAGLVRQLAIEVSPRHVLFGCALRAR